MTITRTVTFANTSFTFGAATLRSFEDNVLPLTGKADLPSLRECWTWVSDRIAFLEGRSAAGKGRKTSAKLAAAKSALRAIVAKATELKAVGVAVDQPEGLDKYVAMGLDRLEAVMARTKDPVKVAAQEAAYAMLKTTVEPTALNPQEVMLREVLITARSIGVDIERVVASI